MTIYLCWLELRAAAAVAVAKLEKSLQPSSAGFHIIIYLKASLRTWKSQLFGEKRDHKMDL